MDPVTVSAIATLSIACSEAAQSLIALQQSESSKKLPPDQKEQLRALTTSLLKLEQTGEILAEAKRLHDTLQRVQTVVHRIAAQYDRALYNQVFQLDKYDAGKVCEIWVEMEFEFSELELFLLKDMHFLGSIASNPNSDSGYDGAQWATSILESRNNVARLVRKRERGERIDNESLAEEVNALIQRVHIAVMMANREIREIANEVSRAFLLLTERLRHVNF